ncbi:MAG: phospholipase D family protein [Opitutales bacterium]|nr:phospholipase D family protein [Opitutales bacterium]
MRHQQSDTNNSKPIIILALLLITILQGCRTLAPIHLTEELASPPPTSELWTEVSQMREGDWTALLNTGDMAFDWRLRAIDSATETVDLQTFLWFDDQIGLAMLHHLFLAADRGVRVRILLDDSFTSAYADAIWMIDHHPNIEFRIYNPYSIRNDNMVLRSILNLGDFKRVNHRMHNKSLIIDNRAAIVGGRNIADEYFGWHSQANFRDLELLCYGEIVQQISQHFDSFWNDEWSYPEAFVNKHVNLEATSDNYAEWVATNTTRHLDETANTRRMAWTALTENAIRADFRILADKPAGDNEGTFESSGATILSSELVELIDQAKKELIMVSAYLIPTEELAAAIARAEARGVDVRILTNSMRSNNHLAAHSAYRHHTRQLIESGANVHEVRIFAKDRNIYMQSPVDTKHLGLHAKFMLIDDTLAIIGSANLDPRSLVLNTEMNLVVESAELNGHLREFIRVDFDQRNAWDLQLQPDGSLHWVADDEVHTSQPANSAIQRIENWILSAMPIEREM